jgi:hypothetical protein
MCLPDFERFDNILESNPLIGYRNWRLIIKNPTILISENQDYNWNKVIEGPHKVKNSNSGIYAYNYYNNYNNYYNYCNYYYNNYNYNNYYNYCNYYYNNYNYNNNYCISGVIKQYGRVAIHKIGRRSEYAKIDRLFTVRETDAKGPKEFLDWIKLFNLIVKNLAERYECETIF